MGGWGMPGNCLAVNERGGDAFEEILSFMLKPWSEVLDKQVAK